MDQNTFEIPAGYEHVVCNLPANNLHGGIQLVLSNLYRERRVDPTYLLLEEQTLSFLVRWIGESMNIRIIPGTDGNEYRRNAARWVLNQTTGTMIQIACEDRLEPATMMFLYQPERNRD